MRRIGRKGRTRERRGRLPSAGASLGAAVALLAVLIASTTPAAGQDLADYDYENLGFRGIGLDGGYVYPTSVDPTWVVGARMDLGYLGPGFRIVPSLSYWSSDLAADEVDDLENRLAELIVDETGGPAPDIDLSPIEWSDLALTVDGHLVWVLPLGFLGYAGAGGSAHLMNGSGESIDGTFIEDLLDSVRAGFNLHTGLELPVHDRLRLYTAARYELLGDLRYFDVRGGVELFLGDPVPGEDRR